MSWGINELKLFFCFLQQACIYSRVLLYFLTDIFSQISDSNGLMIFTKFDQFLKEVLKLPTAVFEGPSFGYTEHSVRTCFPQQVRVNETGFLYCLLIQCFPLKSTVFFGCNLYGFGGRGVGNTQCVI